MKPLACLLATAAILVGQGTIDGPVLGYIWDAESRAIRPVYGIPGAANLGEPVALEVPLKAAFPGSRFAIGIGAEDNRAYLIRGVQAQPLADLAAGANSALLSPSGANAVFVYDAKLVVVTGLPESPKVDREIDLGAEGQARAIAVSDGDATVLAAYDTHLTVFQAENRWNVQQARVRSIHFLDDTEQALVAGAEGVAILDKGSLRPVSSDAALFASGNRRKIVVANENNTMVAVDLESNTSTVVECHCTPTTVAPLSSGALLRVNEGGRQPLWLVDLNGAEARAVFVPALPKPAEE